MKYPIISLLLCWLLALPLAHAQLTDTQIQQIDSLFLDWNRPNHPGGAIGIMRDGQPVFSSAYGLASLEYLVPNSPETRFNIASVSKQFTAMGIVRLHEQGKLSVDDDIRTHLPWLPDFGETITIRHLLHHTSGLRSLHAVLGMAGWRGDDRRSNADLNRLMQQQRELNFEPGADMLYCNTGYMFMADIIEVVTDEPFVDWMQTNIFGPLGMVHTYVEGQYNRVVPHNATSYHGTEPFERAVEYWNYVGSGNMHSTTGDLLRWASNFYAPRAGWETSFQLLQTLDPLNDGKPNDYAFGVVLGDYKGEQYVQHSGSIGGFRAYLRTFPDLRISIAGLTNFSSSNIGGKVNLISDILLGKVDTPAAPIQVLALSPAELQPYEGYYWNEEETAQRRVYLEQDTLRYAISEQNILPLLPTEANTFLLGEAPPYRKVVFDRINPDRRTMRITSGDDPPFVLEAYGPPTPTREVLATYVGNYYSSELETTYRITLEADTLLARHPRHGAMELRLLNEDIIQAPYPLGVLRFQREGGAVVGLRASNGRVRNLWFEKVD